jgi:diguanylate cyclase (GGDEF)-like protein
MPSAPLRRRPQARRAMPARAVAAAVALACALWGGDATARPMAQPASTPAAFQPANELERLAYLGRIQPDVAVAQLLRFADTLPVDDPRHLQALVEVGSEYIALNRADAVEQTALRIERLSDRVSLARPAAMLLRGVWMQSHNEVGRAERQLIEAGALLPATPPRYLRLKLLTGYGAVASRSGRYDEAMRRYDQALRLVDQEGPAFLRIDVRQLISALMLDTGQTDKAPLVIAEQMRLAQAIGDELGLARAWTARAILQTRTGTDALAAFRAALEHARKGGNRHQITLGMANIADYYLSHGDYRTAYDLSQQVLPLAREGDDLRAQSVAYANTGLALISMRRKDEGMPLVQQSMSIDERSGSLSSLTDTAHELGIYLERAGYLPDALAAYHQYRQLSDEANQQDRQRALIELQENLANEGRQHELDMLGRESRLKDEQLLHHELQVRQWTAAGLASLLLLAVMGMLARRLRLRNRQLSASNERLRQQAEIDPLTGLANRHHLQAVLAKRHADALSGTLYLLDVDHFKQINDTCGHAGGDAVLVEIAHRLHQVLRDDDLVVRWGGEEFLVLVRPLPEGEADALAQRLLAVLADTPVLHEERAVPVSASIGYGLFPLNGAGPQPELAVSWQRAVSLVDAAMYLAKSHGRNGACCIHRIDAGGEEIEHLAGHLERAAAEGRAQLRFQSGPAVRRTPS